MRMLTERMKLAGVAAVQKAFELPLVPTIAGAAALGIGTGAYVGHKKEETGLGTAAGILAGVPGAAVGTLLPEYLRVHAPTSDQLGLSKNLQKAWTRRSNTPVAKALPALTGAAGAVGSSYLFSKLLTRLRHKREHPVLNAMEDVRDKVALLDDPRKERRNEAVALGLGAGAAALPFAGLIGQQPMQNGGPVMSGAKFRQQIRKGDVILSGDPNVPGRMEVKPGMLISLATGTPKAYHASVAQNRKLDQIDLTDGSGLIDSMTNMKERLHLLRPQLPPSELAEYNRRVVEQKRTSDVFTRHVKKHFGQLMRTDPDVAAAVRGAGGLHEVVSNAAPRAFYRKRHTAVMGAKELFMPKLRSEAAITQAQVATQAARSAFEKDMPEPSRRAAQVLFDLIKKDPQNAAHFVAGNTGPELSKVLHGIVPKNVGAVCSTLPSTALPIGRHVVPGKLPADIVPSDFLRSPLYRTVAIHNPKQQFPSWYTRGYSKAPNLVRGGLGLGLGAGAYAAYKMLSSDG